MNRIIEMLFLKLDRPTYIWKCFLAATSPGNNQGSRTPNKPVGQCLIHLNAFNLVQQHFIGPSWGTSLCRITILLLVKDVLGKKIL